MNLNPDNCYQALLTHDRRFDGVFFVGVKTTGIYCRTVCPAKTPNFKSCTFYNNAALAERAGFRPCLRCRPELAPGNGIMDSVPRLAAIAANRIEDGALTTGTLEELAGDMGISSRHLRRVVEKEFGVTPIELAQTQRLLYAKRLLTDSKLVITEIAFASGFASVRRFNALFKERYDLNPTDIRRAKTDKKLALLNCDINFTPPFDWNRVSSFLRVRSIPGVESFQNNSYLRTASFGKHHGWLQVTPSFATGFETESGSSSDEHSLRLTVSESLTPVLPRVVARVKRLFDTYADPNAINGSLADLAMKHPGLRLVGAFDGFEMAIRAILGQQVSVAAATTIAGRVAARFGSAIETPYAELTLLTSEARSIADANVTDITALGITTARAETILILSQAVADGKISLEPGADVERTVKDLTDLKGIGEWTAQYIAMRALSWPDAYPHGDLGLKKALGVTSSKEVLAAGEKWRPWRGYAVMHLWESLAD
ncbi:MAG: AlkA N-terminal domain-containing protein [Candidatus Melainabacteria bacterium]|nr:AlkA N-terminal domain-containing protein [Candidatus Melainabacteria bacterium]